jgi:hypothetical protein
MALCEDYASCGSWTLAAARDYPGLFSNHSEQRHSPSSFTVVIFPLAWSMQAGNADSFARKKPLMPKPISQTRSSTLFFVHLLRITSSIAVLFKSLREFFGRMG